MSDTPQGPGWWQASDGNWYPPQEPPTEPTPATQPVPPVPPPAPPGPPTATFGPTPPGPTPPGTGGPNRTPLFIGIAVLVVALGVIGFLLLGGDDDDETSDDSDRTEQTQESDDTDQTEESDDTDQTEESDDTDQTEETDDTDEPADVDLESLLLTPAEVGPEFDEVAMPPRREGTLCGTPSFRDTSDPADEAGIAVESGGGTNSGIEELFLYASESEARDAYETAVAAASCDEGTLGDGTTVSIDGFDATDTVDADEAYGFVLTATDVEVDVLLARVGPILIILQGSEDPTASGSEVNFEDIATRAVEKVKEG